MRQPRPKIGVFDSGVGGITVLTELRRHLTGADFVYLGDTAHVPYGTKSEEQVRRLSRACAKRAKDKGILALVVACNTASSIAIDSIKEVMKTIPVFGVVEPGVQAVINVIDKLATDKLKTTPPILVLATRATVRSGIYGKLLQTALNPKPMAKRKPFTIIEQACPLLVPMIEEGWVDHHILHKTILEYVGPYRDEGPYGDSRASGGGHYAGIALLACTHYPWISYAFQKALPNWIIVDSAHAVAAAVSESQFWRSRKSSNTLPKAPPKVEWIFTDPEAVPAFALSQFRG